MSIADDRVNSRSCDAGWYSVWFVASSSDTLSFSAPDLLVKSRQRLASRNARACIARGCKAQLDASAKPPCFTHSAILSLSRARACAAFYRCNVTPVVTLRSFRTMTRWCQESFLARVLVAALLISLLHPTQAHAVPEYEPSKTPDHDDDGGRSLLGPVAPSNHGTYPCGCATCRGTRCWVVRVVRKHRERGRIDRCAACRCVARESDLARVACSWGPLVLASSWTIS